MRLHLKHLALLVALSAALVALPRPAFPTVTNTVVSTTTANGNGSTTGFSIGFAFLSNSWINVVEWDTSTTPPTSATISQGSGAGKFTISGGNPGTTVVMGTAPTTTQYLVITRSIPLTQTVGFSPSGIFPYQGLSNQLDQVTMTLQNLNAGIGGVSGGGSNTVNLPSGLAYNFLGWNAAANSVVNYPNLSTLRSNDILQFNGSGWMNLNLTGTSVADLINNASTDVLQGAVGGTGHANAGNLTYGVHNLTFALSNDTSLTLPTSGTVVTGTVDNNNTANTIVKRDGSGNFTAGTITATVTGNVTGNVVGNVTGNVSGTSLSVTGTTPIGHGGTGQTTQQAAINALTNTSGSSPNTFLRSDGTDATFQPIGITDVPQGFSRLKLAQDTPNTVVSNDGSGNLAPIAGINFGDVLTFNGVTWESAPIGPGGGAFTQGSVPFASAAGTLTEDNPLLFWDDTAFQLGVGTNNPAGILDVEGGSFSSGAGQGINLIAGPSTMGGQGAGSIVIETQSSGGAGDGNITIRDGSGNGLAVNGGALALQGGSGGAAIQSSSDHLLLNTSGKGAELSGGTHSSIILGSALTELGHLSTTYGIGFGSSDAGGESPVINVLSESASNPPLLDLWRTSATAGLVTSGMDLGEIDFGGAYTTSGGKSSHTLYHTSSHMNSFATQNWGSTAVGSALTFSTVPNGSLTAAEIMRIDQNGFVGIGTTTPSSTLQVAGTVTATNVIDSGLTASTPVISNGSQQLASGSYSGNTTELATVSGAVTSGHAAVWDASGNAIDSGAVAGTVTSVGLSVPSWLTVGSSPVTSSGTIAVTGTSESQNLFLASPNGSAGAMTPRAIVAADVPTLNQDTTGSAGSLTQALTANLPVIGNTTGITTGTRSGNTTQFASVSGSLTSGNVTKSDASGNVVDGGVAASNIVQKTNNLSDVSNANTSLNNLLPSQTTANGKFLQSNGTNSGWASIGVGAVSWVTKTANYVVQSTDVGLIAGTATSSAFSFTLPAASGVSGQSFYFANNSGYNVTLLPNGSDTIYEDSSQTLIPGASVTLISDGSANYNAF